MRRWLGGKLLDRKSGFVMHLTPVVLMMVGFWAPIPEWLSVPLTLVAAALLLLFSWAQWKTEQEAKQPPPPTGVPLS